MPQASQRWQESTMQPTPTMSFCLWRVTWLPTAVTRPMILARHYRVDGVAPFIANRMQVGMADAAVLDLDLHVMGAGVAPLEIEVVQRVVGAGGAVAF